MRTLSTSGVLALVLVLASPSVASAGGQFPSGGGIDDPRGDARGPASARVRAQADVRRVVHELPADRDGLVRVYVRFQHPSLDGPVRRGFLTQFRTGGERYSLEVDGAGGVPRLSTIDDEGDTRRIQPETLTVTSAAGPSRALTVRFSLEWLPSTSPQFRFTTVGVAQRRHQIAGDHTRPSGRLDLPG